jgi:hypothetical protein
MNSIGQAIAMNNECVQLIQDGHIAEGLWMLQRAASTLQDLRWIVVGGGGPMSDMVDIVPIDYCFAREPKDSYPADQHFYVYDRLLRLAPLAVENVLPVPHDACDVNGRLFVVSTAVVFNMALLQHQYAMQHGNASRCLMHAGFLYDTILCLLEHAAHCPNASLRVLHCLVLNNRAHVYYETCQYTASMNCLDDLCDLLVSCDDLLAHCIPDVEAAEIRRNVMYLHLPSTASSA